MRRLFNALIPALVCMFAMPTLAEDQIHTGWLNNLAVGGYDTVAYFKSGGPVKGRKELTTEWKGAEWRFSSQENLDVFIADPERYAPQYGGYCAYAVAKNKLAGIDPTQFTVLDDKLYLNYNAKIQKKWVADKRAFIKKADNNWPSVLK